MAAGRRKIDGQLIRRRCCAVVALLSYLAVTMGFPLPAATSRKSGSGFACQNRSCGCQNAMDCQSGCCCGGGAEKQTALKDYDSPAPPAEPAICPHCGGKKQCDRPSTPEKSCCARKHAQASACSNAPAKTRPTFHWFHGLKAMECKGASTLWITTGAVVLPPDLRPLETTLPVVDRVWPTEFLLVSRATPPLLRPPR